ncbi:MAG: hypothetical protein WCR52_17560 [Bacteroidota bacterium]
MLSIADYKTIPPFIRIVIAVVVAALTGGLLMNLILDFSPFQPPPGVTYSSGSPEYIEWVRSLSVHGWQTILCSMLAGSFLAGFLVNKLSPPANFPPALIAGFCILFYGIVQYLAFYNPEWMTFAACSGCMVFGLLGGRLAGKPRA